MSECRRMGVDIEGIAFKDIESKTITSDMICILCRIFENDEEERKILSGNSEVENEFNIQKLEEFNAREDKVRQKTTHRKSVNHPMETAWDQTSLDEILRQLPKESDEQREIYLLDYDDGVIYKIDCRYKNIKYEGIDGNPLVVFEYEGTEVAEKDLKKFSISKKNIDIKRLTSVKKKKIPLAVPVNNPMDQEESSNQRLRNELILYVDSGIPIIFLRTNEGERAFEAIQWVAEEDDRDIIVWHERGFLDVKKRVWKKDWDVLHTLDVLTTGMDFSNDKEIMPTHPLLNQKIFVMQDLYTLSPDVHMHIVARLRYLAHKIYVGEIKNCNIIVMASDWNIPPELENYVTVLNLRFLTQNEIKQLIIDFCANQKTTKLDDDFIEELSMELKGLPEFNIINILSMSLANDAEITREDIPVMREQKKQIIQKANILDVVETSASLDDVGGLDHLREWLKNKAQIFDNEKINRAIEFGVSIPKGVLIAGMPGCGKSLAAKATAKEFDLPLIRFDMGRLMGKYVGESEANMRMAIEQAEAMAPCILWIDELEKSFAGIGDGGAAEVTMRLFGMFLTWMQDKKSRTFVVATANNIQKLPPELLRKGRFDEIFYVGLPNPTERKSIFELKIKQRRPKDWAEISKRIDEIIFHSRKYSGADIESVVSDAVEIAFLDPNNPGRPVTADDILKAMSKTRALAELDDTLGNLRTWFKKKNFKPASKEDLLDETEKSIYDKIFEKYEKLLQLGKKKQPPKLPQ